MRSHSENPLSGSQEESRGEDLDSSSEETLTSTTEPWTSLSDPEGAEGLSWGALGEIGGTLLKVSQQIAKTVWSAPDASAPRSPQTPGAAPPGSTALLLQDPESLLDGWGKMLDLLQREVLQETPSSQDPSRQVDPLVKGGAPQSPHRAFEYIESPALSSTRKRILESRGVDLSSGPVVSVGSGFRTLRGPRAYHNVERELAYRYRHQAQHSSPPPSSPGEGK